MTFQELKQVRELMTKDHWDEWLSTAREEKKRRLARLQENAAITVPSNGVSTNSISNQGQGPVTSAPPVAPSAVVSSPAAHPEGAASGPSAKPASKGDAVKQKVNLGERRRIKHPRKVVASEAETSVRVLKTALEELWGNVLKASKVDPRPAPSPRLKSLSGSPAQTASQGSASSSKDKEKSASSTISLAKNIISDLKSDIGKASPASQSKM
jgi:hypothetical protein